MSRDSIRIAFTLAALNDLDVLPADVQGAYLNAPTKEKAYTIAGLEFGANNVGRLVLFVRALYGLKSSGVRWVDHMAGTLHEAGYESCKESFGCLDEAEELNQMARSIGNTYLFTLTIFW